MSQTSTQTRAEAVQMVADVLTTPSRSDRILRRADDGHYYTTDAVEYLTSDGRECPPYVRLPAVNEPMSNEEVEEWAAAKIDELDDEIGQ